MLDLQMLFPVSVQLLGTHLPTVIFPIMYYD
jgi:hypothetical protein